MTVDSLDDVYIRHYGALKEQAASTGLDQIAQATNPKPLKAEPRLSADEIMTFWSCMVPCGWSLGGLAAFLLSRRRKNAGRASSVLGSVILGLLSTLCYLIAVLQAGKHDITHEPQHMETIGATKADDHVRGSIKQYQV